MKNVLMSFALAVLCAVSVNAQNAKGDWYVGTGDIANIAWTEWSVAPSVGYAINDNLAVGLNVSQTDSIADMVIDLDAKYFWKGYFVYGSMPNLDTDNLKLGFGKMFTFHKGIYVDPKIVHDMGQGTTNLMLGVGLKF
jgi:hypothetical protein|tara:strand:+ start:133 stop:546 length:414 start_codon:yes stop_codon:yes gene_type:complete